MLPGAILQKTKIFYRNKTVQNVSILLSGKAGIQVVAFISQPLLARLYSPAQFGEFAFFNSILAILLIAACGRYEAGIPISQKTSHAGRLFQLSQLFLIGYSILLVVLFLFAFSPLRQLFIHQGISPSYLWALPLIVLFSGYWQIVQNWLVRFEKFSQVSRVLLIQRIIVLATAVLAYFYPVNGNGLIFSLLTGSLVVFIFSFFTKRFPLRAPIRSLKTYAFHFRDFPSFSVPTLYLNLFITHLPVFWITFFYSKEYAGVYSLAYSLISVPVQLLHFSFGQVFYQQLAQVKNHMRYALFIKYCKIHTFLLGSVALLLTFFGGNITLFLLGSTWSEAGKMVSFMAILMLIQGISGLCMFALNVLRKQHVCLLLKAVQFILLILSFTTGLYFEDIFVALALMVVFGALHLAYTFQMVSKFIVISHDTHSHCSLAN